MHCILLFIGPAGLYTVHICGRGRIFARASYALPACEIETRCKWWGEESDVKLGSLKENVLEDPGTPFCGFPPRFSVLRKTVLLSFFPRLLLPHLKTRFFVGSRLHLFEFFARVTSSFEIRRGAARYQRLLVG